jgi:hypothetical protein
LGVTRISRIAPLVAVAGLGMASTGCTLVSGWSDLQDGSGADAIDAGVDSSSDNHDSGSGQTTDGDASPSQDSAAPDSSSVPPGVLCGSSRCAVGVGCCEGIVGQSTTCVASSQACAIPSAYLTCSDSSQCTVSLGHAAQCCESSESAGVPGASCRTTCAAGTNVVCDPTLVSPTCPSGKTCLPDPDGYGYDTCQ